MGALFSFRYPCIFLGIFCVCLLLSHVPAYACTWGNYTAGNDCCEPYSVANPPTSVCFTSLFAESMVMVESGGSYTANSSCGAGQGRYGITPSQRGSTCSSSPVPCVSSSAYRTCPTLQDQYFDRLVRRTHSSLNAAGAYNYIGQNIDGVLITAAGLVKTAIQFGVSNVMNFLTSDGASNANGGCLQTVRDNLAFHAGDTIFKNRPGCPANPTGPATPPFSPPSCGGSNPTCSFDTSGTGNVSPPSAVSPAPINGAKYERCETHICDKSQSQPFGTYYQHCVGYPGHNAEFSYSKYEGCCPCSESINRCSYCFTFGP